MDKITQEDISPQTERDLTSPLSPKRPRTDSTMTNNHSGNSSFNFPEVLTFWKTTGFPIQTNVLLNDAALVCTAECEHIESEKQGAKSFATPITILTCSQTNDVHTGSEVCVTAAERHSQILVKDELPLVTETDKLSSHPVDDAGGVLAESHTSKDASTDASSHPDCKRLGKSLEGQPPGGCNLPAGNDEDGRQVQSRVSQIRASDEEVRCRPDCTYEDALRDMGFCNAWSQSAETEKSNQRRDEPRVCENIFFSKEKEESNSPSDYADSKTFCSSSEEGSSGNSVESVRNEGKIFELQICENENVTACDGETKGKVNENGMTKNFIPSVAERAEGSIVSDDVLLDRNIAIEDVGPEAGNFCGAKGEHAAGKMIAKARSEMADHTAETPMPARISQKPAEGDNDAGPFSVIDPAIWSEIDREAGEERCFSGSTTALALYPSVKVCTTETRPPLCADVKPSPEPSAADQPATFNHQSKTQQGQDEKEELCQSHTEPQASSISTTESHNTINGASFHWKSNPSSSPWQPKNPPPAGDGRQESRGTARPQLKVQDQSGFSPVSLNHLKTEEVEYLQNETARMDGATEIKESEEITSFEVEIRADEHGKSENSMDSDKLLQHNMNHKEDLSQISTGDCVNDCTEGKISQYSNDFTRVDEELKNNIECCSDHAYSAVIPTMEVTTEGQERGAEASVGEEADVHGNLEILPKSEDCHQQRRQQEGDLTEASADEYSSEGTHGNLSESGCKLTQVSQRTQGIRLSCFSEDRHRAETFVGENKDDILAFIFPPTRDAVVPGRHELIHSQNANSSPAALNCSDRFSSVPSACTFYNHVPGGVDTFEKMKLSLDDDDDDDAGLSNSPVLINLLKTPQQQLYHSMPEAESSELPGEEDEEEVTRSQCHSENIANGFLNSDCSCNELLNFISAADVIPLGWPGQQPNCESAYNSSECFQEDLNAGSMSSTVSSKSVSPASDVNNRPEFEMKKQFDMVLKELNLYFDISLSDFAIDSRSSSPKWGIDKAENLKGDTDCQEHLNRPDLGHHPDTASDDAGEDCSLDMYGGDPGVSCTSGSGDREQEVPLSSHLCQEASMYTAKKHREPLEMEQRRKTWSPSLMCGSPLEQLSHRPPEQHKRLEPLRTCTKPLRVGLSKRAKTKHLHRPHPYK